MTTKEIGAIILVALVFSIGTFYLFPQEVEVDYTDYTSLVALQDEVVALEGELNILTTESEDNAIDQETMAQLQLSLDEATTKVAELEELPIKTFSFMEWVLGLMESAEDDADLTFNGSVYEGDDGEWDFDELDGDECRIIDFDKDLEDGTLSCEDIEIETDDDDDIKCDIEIEFDEDMDYDDAEITNCVIN